MIFDVSVSSTFLFNHLNQSKRDGHIWETLEEQTDPRSVPLLPRVGYHGVLPIDSTTLTNNAFAPGKRSLPLTLSPTERFNASSFSTRIGRVGFSSTSGLSSHGDTEQSNQDRSEHRFLSMRQFVTVFTCLTSVEVNLKESRITITVTAVASHIIAPSRANLLLRYHDAIMFSRNRVNGSERVQVWAHCLSLSCVVSLC